MTKVIKEYKDENVKLQSKIDDYAKIVGKMTVEKEWLEGKLQSLDLSDKKELIESELSYISVSTQCKLLKLNPSSLYYKPTISEHKLSRKEKINDIYEEIADLPQEIELGMDLEGEDEESVWIVEKIEDGYATLNANHELAGITLVIFGEVLELEHLSSDAVEKILSMEDEH